MTTNTTAPHNFAPAWSRTLLIYGVIALAGIACWPGTVALYKYWTDVANLSGTHGLLIFGLTLWLVFRARGRLAAAPIQPSSLACAGVVLCGFLWVVLLRSGLQDPQLLFLPIHIWLVIAAAFGWSVARTLAFPIGFLYFAMPAWGHVAVPLQMITTHVVGILTWIARVPTYIEGNLVTIPEGRFEIAEGCSGVHFLVVGLAVSAMLGELGRESLRTRALLIGLMAALALVANWIRVFVIVLAGHFTQMRHPLITEGHYWFGWGVFAVALVAFLWITNRWGRGPDVAEPEATPVQPVRVTAFAAAVLALVAAPAAALLVDALNSSRGGSFDVPLPKASGIWDGPSSVTASAWQPEFVNADVLRLGAYREASGAEVEALAVGYRSQRQGAELVNDSNSLLGSRGLTPQGADRVTTQAGPFREVRAADTDGRQSLVWFYYDIGGRRFVTPLYSQIWYGVRSLISPPGSALLAFRAECVPTCQGARDRLEDFVAGIERRELAAAVGSHARVGP